MLFERQDTVPNTVSARHTQTPLLLARIGGLEAILRWLFAREDINPNIVDTGCGRIPLGRARAGGGGVPELWGYCWNESIPHFLSQPEMALRLTRTEMVK